MSKRCITDSSGGGKKYPRIPAINWYSNMVYWNIWYIGIQYGIWYIPKQERGQQPSAPPESSRKLSNTSPPPLSKDYAFSKNLDFWARYWALPHITSIPRSVIQCPLLLFNRSRYPRKCPTKLVVKEAT